MTMMNSKELKRCKSAKEGLRSNSSDDEAQVFVLSPDILQKLGINLGNIKNDQECPMDFNDQRDINSINNQHTTSLIKDIPNIIPEPHVNSRTDKESSILETANLMKKSVFLSPTFIPVTANTIPGEIEIANIVKEPVNILGDILGTEACDTIPRNHAESYIINDSSKLDEVSLTFSKTSCTNEINVPNEDNNSYYQTNDNKSSNRLSGLANFDKKMDHLQCESNVNCMKGCIKINVTTVDDCSLKEFSSECNNKSLESTGFTGNLFCVPKKDSVSQPKHLLNKNKINIISEEVINSSQMMDFKFLHSPKKSDLIPVTINTLISKNKVNNFPLETTLPRNSNTISKTETKDEIDEKNVIDMKVKKSYNNSEVLQSKSIIIYDVKGNRVETTNADVSVTPVIDSNNDDLIANTSLTNTSSPDHSYNEKTLEDSKEIVVINKKSQMIDRKERSIVNKCGNNFCLDFVETGVEKNEVVLQDFVNSVTLSDCSEIIQKVEINEKDSSQVSNIFPIEDIQMLINNNTLSNLNNISQIIDIVPEYENKSIFNCNRIHNNSNEVNNKNQTVNTVIDVTSLNAENKISQRSDTLGDKQSLVEFTNETNVIEQTLIPINECQHQQIEHLEIPVEKRTTEQKSDNVIIENIQLHKKINNTMNQDGSPFVNTILTHNCTEIVNENNEFPDSQYSSFNANIPVDKVHEIATYLNKYARRHSEKRKFLFRTKLNNSNKMFMPKQSKCINKSKICIQGVEKPGGVNNCLKYEFDSKNCRTYQRRNIRRKYSSATSGFQRELIYKQSDVLESDINIINNESNADFFNKHTFCEKDEFCLCNDFGSLSYHVYGSYEHIHFSKRRNIDCNFDSIYSIYNKECEDYNFTNRESLIDEQADKGNFEKAEYKICWSNIENDRNIMDKEIDEEQPCVGKDVFTQKPDISSFEAENNLSFEVEQCVSSDILKTNVLNNDNTEQQLKESIPLKLFETSDVEIVIEVENGVSDLNSLCFKKPEINGTKEINEETLLVNKQVNNKTNIPNQQTSKLLDNKTTCEMANEPRRVKKRRKSSQERTDENKVTDTPNIKKNIKCDVCKQMLSEVKWEDHVTNDHCYIAWRVGQAFDFEDPELFQKLHQKVKSDGSLKCSICGTERKYVKSFLSHVEKCLKEKDLLNISSSNVEATATTSDIEAKKESLPPKDKLEKCGACNQELEASNWIKHISKEHNYLAWKDGEPHLDVNDEETVRQHLYAFTKQCGGLICGKCGLVRKYVKSYLQHIANCDGKISSNKDCTLNSSGDTSIMESETSSTMDNSNIETINGDMIKCGVCQKELVAAQWMDHIQKSHNYLAWIEGQPALDVDNAEEVQKHLFAITKKLNGLTCVKCGVVRKYVKSFLQHINNCGSRNLSCDSSIIEADSQLTNKGILVCAVCSEKVESKDWKVHSMKKHYNVAWVVGDIPIDVKSPYAVLRFLNEYKQLSKNLVCNNCGISRASCIGFYAHVITCGKTEEETDMYKEYCEICNSKYLCIYKSQHMTMHREQEFAKERKLKAAERKEEETVQIGLQLGRRRAAEKAKSVIENYKCNINEYEYNCPSCGFGCDNKKGITEHKCGETKVGDFSDSDVSVKLEAESDESSDDDVDSNVSEEEADKKKKRHRESGSAPKPSKIPFAIRSPETYLLQSAIDYHKFHQTNEKLYAQWQISEMEAVPEDQLSKYMPPLENSCKVKFGTTKWTTYERFEAKMENGYSIFVGASIQRVSWAPRHMDDENCYGNYLAIACHSGADCPRFNYDEVPEHPNLLQIWDFGNLKKSVPKFVLGLAHDFGTVWSLDWCPSGARDLLSGKLETEMSLRLGLLAISCSNGSAYILAVPYPSEIIRNDNHPIYKIKPVAELRLTMSSERKKYQATCLSWSTQKGNTVVVVGYSDGTIAYYDLVCDSPLLTTTENKVTIVYPYHEERPHNSCVTDVSTFPGTDTSVGVGAVCSSSNTGVAATSGGHLAYARLYTHLPGSQVVFTPHWPSVVIAGDDPFISQTTNELDWSGGGRRLGSMQSLCGCLYCGCLASSSLSILQLMQPHPAYSDPMKQVLGILHMTLLSYKKNVKQANDELAMRLEPITYEDSIKKYGIEFQPINRRDKDAQQQLFSKQREQYPERFPLADVPSMAFCNSVKHHTWLAIATHAGILFLVNTLS